MEFIQHYSSSRGNLYAVRSASGRRLLIECGVSWEKLLKSLDWRLDDISGCLVSHSHGDHCNRRSVSRLCLCGIPVYASEGTIESSSLPCRSLPLERIVGIGPFQVLPFETHHDCYGSIGFVVRVDKEYLLFATDTSHIHYQFKYPFSILALECSYDREILQYRVDTGDIEEHLAKRLLTSHMEKDDAIRYIDEFCDLSRCRKIHLLHLSEKNIDPDTVKKDFFTRFFLDIETIL